MHAGQGKAFDKLPTNLFTRGRGIDCFSIGKSMKIGLDSRSHFLYIAFPGGAGKSSVSGSSLSCASSISIKFFPYFHKSTEHGTICISIDETQQNNHTHHNLYCSRSLVAASRVCQA